MNALFRMRIPKKLLEDTEKTLDRMGISSQALVKALFVQVVLRREIPFRITAESPEDELLPPKAKRAELLEMFYDYESKAR